MYTELLEKQTAVLETVKQAVADFENINAAANAEKESNTKVIIELTKENSNLGGLVTQNSGSIKILNKILGKWYASRLH